MRKLKYKYDYSNVRIGRKWWLKLKTLQNEIFKEINNKVTINDVLEKLFDCYESVVGKL